MSLQPNKFRNRSKRKSKSAEPLPPQHVCLEVKVTSDKDISHDQAASKINHDPTHQEAGKDTKNKTATEEYDNTDSKQSKQQSTNSATAKEPSTTIKTDANNPTVETLETELKAKGLNPLYWSKLFKEQGIEDKEQFKHIDQLTLNNLLSKTNYTWERSALNNLANVDEHSRQEAMFEKLRSMLPDPQKHFTDTMKENDDRKKKIFEENTWVKQFDLDNKVRDKLKIETSGQQIIERKTLKSCNLIRKISAGQILRGQFMYKNFKTSSTYRQQLIEVENSIALMSPEISETMETFELNDKEQSDIFDSALSQYGLSLAVGLLTGPSFITGGKLGFSFGYSSDKQKKTTTNKQELFVKISQILTVPMASVTLSNQKVNLSEKALKALKELNKSENFKEECKLFFHEFGSHYYTGICHFGGRYNWTVTSVANSKEDRTENIEMTKLALGGAISGGNTWAGIEVKGSFDHKSENVKKNRTSKEKCEVAKTLKKLGGPQEVDDVSLWKRGLAQYNETWTIIDKEVSQKCYEGVWELVARQKNEFTNADDFITKLHKEWKILYEEKESEMVWSKPQLFLDEETQINKVESEDVPGIQARHSKMQSMNEMKDAKE